MAQVNNLDADGPFGTLFVVDARFFLVRTGTTKPPDKEH
jgi:hypothetical protein